MKFLNSVGLVIVLLASGVAQSEAIYEKVDLQIGPLGEVSVTIKKPKKSNGDKLPVIIVFGGFETGEKSLGMIDIKQPTLLATFDYPYQAPENRNLVRDLMQISEIGRSLRKTDLGIAKLVDYLKTRKDVNEKSIAIAGVSFGAPIALYAASSVKPISYVIIGHGFARVELAIEQQLKNVWCPRFWCKPAAFLASRIAWWFMDYHEPLDVMKTYPNKPTLLMFPLVDDQVPHEAIDALKNAFMKSKARYKVITTNGGHITPGNQSVLAQMLDYTQSWLTEEGFFKP